MRLVTLFAVATCALLPAGSAVAAEGQPQAPVTVARYSFDTGGAGTIADLSGRGVPLRIRSADGGELRFIPHETGRAVAFPARCAANTGPCPRVVLEGTDDADLDPGTQSFRFGASVLATPAQVGSGANIMQKGVATNESQWKLQIGRRGKPNCVLVGRGSTQNYLARGNFVVTDGSWHEISCRRAGTTLSIAVDGTIHDSVTVPATLDVTNALPLRVGGRNLNSRSDQFGGAIDEVYAVLG